MVRRYDLAMSEPVTEELTEDVQRIVQGYTFDEPAIELGVLMENDVTYSTRHRPHPLEHAEPAWARRRRDRYREDQDTAIDG